MSGKRDKKGKFLERPSGAAPEFDSESGSNAALSRWKDKADRNKLLAVESVARALDIDPTTLTYDEAFHEVIIDPLVQSALKRNTAAIKELATLMDERPVGADAKTFVDKRQVNFMNFRFTTEQARAYIEHQKAQGNDKVASLVDSQMNWDAEEDEVVIVAVPIDDKD